MSQAGYLTIVDRTKDMIKTGGERPSGGGIPCWSSRGGIRTGGIRPFGPAARCGAGTVARL